MSKLSLIIRSIIFNILFLFGSLLISASVIITLPLPAICTTRLAKIWSRYSLWALKKVCKLDYEIKGIENIPQNTKVILASKHQSAWETVAYQHFFYPTVFMFKKELLFIPFFGLAILKTGSIPVNRGHGSRKMIQDLSKKFKNRLTKANIIIFPEGTRTKPNAKPNYKSGLTLITDNLKDATILPIAMNSGTYWPKGSFIKYPGTIKMSILPPIKRGNLSHSEFQELLVNTIEDEMKKL